MNQLRNCPVCRRVLAGRTDKRFCSDGCRNTWHNHYRLPANMALRNTHRILQKNRNVLENLLPPGREEVRTRIVLLEAQGFRFGYCTAAQYRESGSLVFFCYEYGYQPLNRVWCRVFLHRVPAL